MSSDPTVIQKSDQIAHRFFAKFALVIHHARILGNAQSESARVDKWFNLETPDTDVYKDNLRLYRSISSMSSVPPQFELQVLLAVPELSNNQVLCLGEPMTSRVRVDPIPTHILLESWILTFVPSSGQYQSRANDRGDVTLATVYKHGISLFRSLFTLLRVLPAWQFFKRLRRRPNTSGGLGIEIRVGGLDAYNEGLDILEFDAPVSSVAPALPTSSHIFAPIMHPFGTISAAVTYLTSPHFQIDTLEALLSSRFLDEGPEFTPTLARNQQRESLSTSPGSLPIRTSLPRSPPSNAASLADRFVLPAAGSRTSFPGSSPRYRGANLPALAGSTGSGASSSRLSQEGQVASALPARVRQESIGGGRSSSELPSAPSPLPIRRPSLVQPFKSSTLSSGSPSLHSASTSLRHQSPLAQGPSLPSRPPATASPTSGTRFRMYEGSVSSPMGLGGRMASSPAASSRPSPAMTPSSLNDKRSVVNALDVPERRQRYSSSFGYRYAQASGPASDGSAGSSERERRDNERPGSASYLSTNTDDDDLSMFMQDIDARRPLGRGTSGLGPGRTQRGHERSATEQFPRIHQSRVQTGSQPSSPPRPSITRHERERALSESSSLPNVSNAVLMSQLAIEERLKQVNEMFQTSMSGLQGRRVRASSTADAETPGIISTRRERGNLVLEGGRRLPSGIRESSEDEQSDHNRSLNYLTERRASAGSGGSGFASGAPSIAASERSDVGYGYRRARIGSTTSIGSEEVLGKLELDTTQDSSGSSGRGAWRGRGYGGR